MRRIKLILSAAILASAFFTSCSGNKVKGEKSINVPCTEPKYFSDKKFFRANGIGESMDQATAQKKAEANAREKLSTDIQSTMKVVGDNYVNSTEFNNKEELTETFQQNARTVVNQVLTGIGTACYVPKKTSDGNYKIYLTLEVSKEDMLNAMDKSLSNDEKLKAMYNYEKFKETFDAEMNKLENE